MLIFLLIVDLCAFAVTAGLAVIHPSWRDMLLALGWALAAAIAGSQAWQQLLGAIHGEKEASERH